jgi:hypothetical protein
MSSCPAGLSPYEYRDGRHGIEIFQVQIVVFDFDFELFLDEQHQLHGKQ